MALLRGDRFAHGPSKTPLKTINNPQGGKIVYGLVDGRAARRAAMGRDAARSATPVRREAASWEDLSSARYRFSRVYFTVVKRTQGNKPVAGLLIATQAAPNHVEAALVSDDASRFGSTVNPMLRQLFSVWHPGGATANASCAAGEEFGASSGLRRSHGWTFGGGSPGFTRSRCRTILPASASPTGGSLIPKSAAGNHRSGRSTWGRGGDRSQHGVFGTGPDNPASSERGRAASGRLRTWFSTRTTGIW